MKTKKPSYNDVKQRLLHHYPQSDKKKLHQLLYQLKLGDMKPTHLLRKMKTLSTEIPDKVLKFLWLKKLPRTVQIILKASLDKTLDELAAMADSIMEEDSSYQCEAIDKDYNS